MQILTNKFYQLDKSFLKTLWKPWVAVAMLLLLCPQVLTAQIHLSREYQLKAAFLFNFTQFVDWPESSFTTDGSSWVIGILGENPFNAYLEEIVSGEKVKGHPVIVRYYKSTAEIKECHILFINLADKRKQELAIADLKDSNILTVSDMPPFMQSGGIVGLLTQNNKIKIQINLEAAKAANLTISSKLLRLAEIFIPTKNN